ncbi:MAG TPA: IclR family transcriptional regulator [Gaiellaceae bacterium]|nr:IclR family transcriptional regulator [Gaiellaceae bacterium]
MSAPTGTRAIDRAAQLLVRVVENAEPETVTELAETTGLPKSTASRLVAALERQGLVQREGGRGSVHPGPVLVSFARRGVPNADLVELCGPSLDRLAQATGETVNLAVPAARGVEQLAQRDSRHFLGSTNWVGRTVPYHASAVGKVFLAFEAVRLPKQLEQLTPRTVNREELEQALADIVSSGYAIAVEELEPGLWAIAAPLRNASGVVAALSISGPTIRLHDGLLEELGRRLIAETAAVSARLQ